MESANNDGSSSEIRGMIGPRSHLQQHAAFPEQGLSYFDQNTMHADGHHKTDPRQHQIRKANDTGSPPPNSATTSGSTSTPTSPSTGGLSSSADAQKHSESGHRLPKRRLSDGSPSPYLPHVHHHPQVQNRWPVSVSNNLVAQPPQYPSSPAPVALSVEEQNFSQSPGAPYNTSAYPSAIKLLVTNNVAGSIIGRAGQTISELQNQSSARIKLSQTGDFYPGTQDRVCLVQGQVENVKLAVRLLLERIYMLQEQQHTEHLSWQPKPNEGAPVGFDFVVRLLVPSSSCGMIIGKAGSNIKHMEGTSGVSSVRLSPKENSDPSSPTAAIVSGTSERIVTLTGPTMESCLTCLCIVLDNMMAHHEISRYSNMTTSYSRVVVQGAFGTVPPPAIPGRPLVVVPPGAPEWHSGDPYSELAPSKRSSSSPDLAGQMLWDQGAAPRMQQENSQDSMGSAQPRDPAQQYNPIFAEGAQSYTQEMPPMMSSPPRGPPASANPPPVYLLPSPHPNQLDRHSIPNSVSAPDLLALQLQDSLRINTPPASGTVDYTHFAPQLPQPTPPGFTAQVLVPDTLIGSILGRGGRTLNELQMHSNTRIRISQRGEYMPGTRNRIVTIRGPTSHSVSLAQYLMSQRIVLPPTANFSPQSPLHPPPVQQPQPSQHPSQQPHQAQRQDIHSSHYYGSPVDGPFQGSDSHGHHPPSSSSLSRANTEKEISHS